jgi:hypothetical protein
MKPLPYFFKRKPGEGLSISSWEASVQEGLLIQLKRIIYIL